MSSDSLLVRTLKIQLDKAGVLIESLQRRVTHLQNENNRLQNELNMARQSNFKTDFPK